MSRRVPPAPLTSRGPLPLVPSLRHYAWGDVRYIPELLGFEADGTPVAEAWYGAHPIAPATARWAGEDSRLDALVEHLGASLLGPRVSAQGGSLPYLLKVLAAARPLSIQVHPNREQARAGFAREQALGIPVDAPNRSYRDATHKPELLVALTPFEALCGFRPWAESAERLARAPELMELLPPYEPTAESTRALLQRWYALPVATVTPALDALIARLGRDRDRWSEGDPELEVLDVHERLGGAPDRGLLFVYVLDRVVLDPGQGFFIPAGVPHAYLRGAGIELMASSDNVLRAGLTSKHIDPEELLRTVVFEPTTPPVLDPVPCDAVGREAAYPCPAEEVALIRTRLDGKRGIEFETNGPETLLALTSSPEVRVRVGVEGGEEIALERGRACLLPDGCIFTLEANGPAEVFRASMPLAEATKSVGNEQLTDAVRRNIEITEALFREGEPPSIIGTVSGSAGAQRFWQERLDQVRGLFRAEEALSFHEDLPVNQAFGLLLLWQRLRPHLTPGKGALIAFVFGEGSRAAPLTEAEGGQKPAIASFAAMGEGDQRRYLSTVELALRYFAPIELYLRRSGFDGMVVKWGDEIQIPTLDLGGRDPRLEGADVVRFVSMRPITEDTAANKDWVGVDADGNITAFIPRRPLAEMEPLADRGLVRRRGGQLFGGVNLGSVALSRVFLDVLLEELSEEVNDPDADRKKRPDLDPQLFTVLTIAAIADPAARAEAWATALSENASMRSLDGHLPGILERMRKVIETLEAKQGRPIRMVALDFCDQYWGDIGQHRKMREMYAALGAEGPTGEIARAIAGLEVEPDVDGNYVDPASRLGPGVRAKGSVFIDAQIEEGEISNSVLVGTRAATVEAEEAFDVGSVAPGLKLGAEAGTYRVVSAQPVEVEAGARLTTVFGSEGPVSMRVHEDTDLRNKAETYDTPILGNPVSFAELHRDVLDADPRQIQTRREEARAAVLRTLGMD